MPIPASNPEEGWRELYKYMIHNFRSLRRHWIPSQSLACRPDASGIRVFCRFRSGKYGLRPSRNPADVHEEERKREIRARHVQLLQEKKARSKELEQARKAKVNMNKNKLIQKHEFNTSKNKENKTSGRTNGTCRFPPIARSKSLMPYKSLPRVRSFNQPNRSGQVSMMRRARSKSPPNCPIPAKKSRSNGVHVSYRDLSQDDPLYPLSDKKGAILGLDLDAGKVSCYSGSSGERDFKFGAVFDGRHGQEQVQDALSINITQHMLAGYNIYIYIYISKDRQINRPMPHSVFFSHSFHM